MIGQGLFRKLALDRNERWFKKQLNTGMGFSKLISVPFMANTSVDGNDGICTYASMASLVAYKNNDGKKMSALTLYDEFEKKYRLSHNDSEVPHGTDTSIFACGILYGLLIDKFEALPVSTIARNVSDSNPMLITLWRSEGTYHTLVLCGIDTDGTEADLFLMDPNKKEYAKLHLDAGYDPTKGNVSYDGYTRWVSTFVAKQ